jgi:heme-degrading monooxygenase HmoA
MHTAPSSQSKTTNAAMAIAAAAITLGSAADVAAQTAPTIATPVVVIVKVPKPWYAPQGVVVGKMRDTIAQYASLPGLAFKAFSFEKTSGDYGGVYYWRDAASAKAWFNPAWFERVKKERGHDASVRFIEAPVSLDNTPGGTPASPDSKAVVTHVEISIPAGIAMSYITAEFAKAAAQYQQVPGLMRKHFTITDAGTFGGVYLWRDEASAKAWFNEPWHQRVIKTYGKDAKIEWFDAPILLPSQDSRNAIAAPAMIAAAP